MPVDRAANKRIALGKQKNYRKQGYRTKISKRKKGYAVYYYEPVEWQLKWKGKRF